MTDSIPSREPLPVVPVRPRFHLRMDLKPLPPATEAKLGKLAEMMRRKMPADLRESGLLEKLKLFLTYMIDEESTDTLASIVGDFIPFKLGWLVEKALDKLLPEKLLHMLFVLLDKLDGGENHA